MRYQSLDSKDLRIASSNSARHLKEDSVQEGFSSPGYTREWAHDFLAHTPLYKSIDAATLASLGAKSFAAYKEKKKQHCGDNSPRQNSHCAQSKYVSRYTDTDSARPSTSLKGEPHEGHRHQRQLQRSGGRSVVEAKESASRSGSSHNGIKDPTCYWLPTADQRSRHSSTLPPAKRGETFSVASAVTAESRLMAENRALKAEVKDLKMQLANSRFKVEELAGQQRRSSSSTNRKPSLSSRLRPSSILEKGDFPVPELPGSTCSDFPIRRSQDRHPLAYLKSTRGQTPILSHQI